MKISEVVEKKFVELFHETPIIIRSPGRVNLIGEHTDYNMGFVLPAAIDKAIYFALSPAADSRCRLYSYDLKDEYHFSLENLEHSKKSWPNYLIGVVDQMMKNGHTVGGFNCVFGGNIPIGAGLSSSAAIEAGLIFGLSRLFNLDIDKLDMVKMAQKAENEFVGVKCGIMDQFINIFGEQDNVLKIDCRSLEYEYLPFNHNVAIVLFDSCVKHSLASSEYNKRREECDAGVEIIRRQHPSVTHLRDVSPEMLASVKSKMNDLTYRRCKYVVEEDTRLLAACDALKENDLQSFGTFMFETHEGLKNDYEVSCKELDVLVELVKNNPKVYGARMMGGGFGGCTINLVEPDAVVQVCSSVGKEYAKVFGAEPKAYITSISAGTEILSADEYAKD
jgi:galactokinase